MCIPCPGLDVTSGAVTAGVKCSGGSVTYEPGFWRPPSSLAEGVKPDTVFHQCVPGACITDEQHGNVTCATGQRGPLCAVCEEGYAPAGQLCAKCWSPAASYAATIAAVMAVSCILAVVVRRSTGHRSELMAVCRIMLNWLQLTSALGTFALKAPEVASDMLNLSSASDGISLNAFFVQCAVRFTYYSLYASYCAFPFVTVGLVGLVCTTGYWIQVWRQRPIASRRARLRRQFTDWFKMASTVLICVSYVKVSREILGLFELYTPAIDGTFYLKGDMSVAAFTPEHITAMVVGVVMVIVYIAGVPAGTAAMLHHAKRKIINNSPTFRRKYGFLFDGYDAERGWYWWEAVVMLRKVLVTSIAVFINDGFFQTYAAAMLVTTALVAQAWVSPFESDLHNNLELVSLISSQITQVRIHAHRHSWLYVLEVDNGSLHFAVVRLADGFDCVLALSRARTYHHACSGRGELCHRSHIFARHGVCVTEECVLRKRCACEVEGTWCTYRRLLCKALTTAWFDSPAKHQGSHAGDGARPDFRVGSHALARCSRRQLSPNENDTVVPALPMTPLRLLIRSGSLPTAATRFLATAKAPTLRQDMPLAPSSVPDTVQGKPRRRMPSSTAWQRR